MASIHSNNYLPLEEDGKERAREDAFRDLVKSKQFTILNGKVGQPYHFQLKQELLDGCQIGEYWFDDLPEGISFDKENHTLDGIPSIAGDYAVQWFYKHKSWTEDRAPLSHKITIIINPDPRSLWNNIPTPLDIPFYKPDSDKQLVLIDNQKSLLAASQRGRSHAHEGVARDDDFKLSFNQESGWYIIAVADGAGSAKLSRRGSEIACNTVIDICTDSLNKNTELENTIEIYRKDNSQHNKENIRQAISDVLFSTIQGSFKQIQEEAEKSENQSKDFATTLLISICKKFDFGWVVASYWVGDGAIAIYQKDSDFLQIMGDVDSGEFAGQTRFLTMPEIINKEETIRRVRLEIVEDFTALILLTDGITDPKFETDANLQRKEKWDAFWADINTEVLFDKENLEMDTQLLKWLDFWSVGNHDDRTIALLF